MNRERMNAGHQEWTTNMRRTAVLGALIALVLGGGRSLAGQQDSVVVINPDAPVDQASERPGLPPELIARVVTFFNDSGTIRLEGELNLPRGAKMDGPVAILRGPVTVRGEVAGPLMVINGDLRLGATGVVHGDILVVGGAITFDSGSVHDGTADQIAQTVPVLRNAKGLLEARERRRSLLDFGGAQASFQTGQVRTTLFLSSGGTYNRVEGLPVTLGPRFDWQVGPFATARLDLQAIIRTAGDPANLREDVGYFASTEWQMGRRKRHQIGFGLRASQTVAAIEDQPLSRSEDGWGSLLLRRDYRDYYINEGVGAFFYSYFGPDFRLEVGARSESQRSVRPTTAWSLFRSDQVWRANPLIDDGRYVTYDLGMEYDTRNQSPLPSAGWWLRGRIERSGSRNVAPLSLPTTIRGSIPTDGSYSFGRLWFDARMYNRLTPDMRLNARITGGGWMGGDPLPLQRRVALGGPDILPGYGFRASNCAASGYSDPADPALCDRMLAAQLELRSRLNLGLLFHYRDVEHGNLDRAFGLTQADLVVFSDAGTGWLTGVGPGRVPNDRIPAFREWKADVGVGLDAGGIGVYLAKGLTDGQPVQFTVRLQQRF
ncbi:MAG: hypothetical protein ACHQXA_00865 [Gemmatimonadales bacterium]